MNEAMVGVTSCAGHHSGVKAVFAVFAGCIQLVFRLSFVGRWCS